jgi:hypothetical protein
VQQVPAKSLTQATAIQLDQDEADGSRVLYGSRPWDRRYQNSEAWNDWRIPQVVEILLAELQQGKAYELTRPVIRIRDSYQK